MRLLIHNPSYAFRAFLACLFLLASLFLPAKSFAGSFKLRWVEVDVILDKDAKAQVSYTVRWSADNGNLHGFYFEGFTGVNAVEI